MRYSAAIFYLLCTTTLIAQTALRSKNFILYNNSSTLRIAAESLTRLEQLRSAILALHGEAWALTAPLHVWVPKSESDWRELTLRDSEQGLFLSGPRINWIIVNPKTANFFEVLSHEYIHAVLHQVLPNLPTWFEEGICEYYSTLQMRSKGNQTTAVLGRPPAQRLKELTGLESINIVELDNQSLKENAYARAWAAAYHLLPGYKPGDPLPREISIGKFPLREIPLKLEIEKPTFTTLSLAEMADLEIEFHIASPMAPPLSEAGQAASKAEQLFLEGLRLADQSKPLAAIPLLEKACKLRPSNSTWWQALALTYKEAQQLPAARLAIERAIATATSASETTAALTLQKSLQ